MLAKANPRMSVARSQYLQAMLAASRRPPLSRLRMFYAFLARLVVRRLMSGRQDRCSFSPKIDGVDSD